MNGNSQPPSSPALLPQEKVAAPSLVCGVCHEERPDRCISVLQAPGQDDIEYCNDRGLCSIMAKRRMSERARTLDSLAFDSCNRFLVGVRGQALVIQSFRQTLSKDEAINLAVWLKCLAADDQQFDRVENAVRNS